MTTLLRLVQPVPDPVQVQPMIGPVEGGIVIEANNDLGAQLMDLDSINLNKSQRGKKKTVSIAPNQPRYSLQKLHVRTESQPITELFQVGTVLGQGAFGIVRACVRISDGKSVAVKQINLQGKSASEVKMAERETTILMQTRCDDEAKCALVKIYDSFFTGNKEYLWIVMELVQGGDGEKLKKELHKELKLNWKRTMSGFLLAVMPMFYTLRQIHENKVLHRDIKPPNLLFDRVRSRLLLSDFGLACLKRDCDGQLAGTPLYLDPRALECGVLDIWSDIYSLGATLYEMVLNEHLITSFLPSSQEWPEFHRTRMTRLDPLLAMYESSSPEFVVLTAIGMMTVPLDHLRRPSLDSVLKAVRAADSRLLRHSGDSEFNQGTPATCSLKK